MKSPVEIIESMISDIEALRTGPESFANGGGDAMWWPNLAILLDEAKANLPAYKAKQAKINEAIEAATTQLEQMERMFSGVGDTEFEQALSNLRDLEDLDETPNKQVQPKIG